LLIRRYADGTRLRYRMTADENGTSSAVTITATTRKTADGRFIDEFAWSDMVVNGAARVLSPTSQAFRATVTLDGGRPFDPPDLSKAPGLVGPVTDLLTFYSDLFLAMHHGALRQAGDRFHFSNPMPASWADGTTVVLGEDHIDFDIALTAVDRGAGEVTLSVNHVPPPAPKIRLPTVNRPVSVW
jgi:hypothetical protein